MSRCRYLNTPYLSLLRLKSLALPCSSSFSVMLRLKALTSLLLLLLLALCSGVHLCDARSRTTRGGSGAAPSASAAAIGRKGKARSSGSSHRQSGEGSRSPTEGDPVQGDGSQAPAQDTVFSVLEFGAKGDGVTDDTQVTCLSKCSARFCSGITGTFNYVHPCDLQRHVRQASNSVRSLELWIH